MDDKPFELRYPPLIRCGWGVRQDVPRVLADTGGWETPRVFLVASQSAMAGGRLAEFESLCGGFCGQVLGIPHDPPLASVDALLRAIRESDTEVVLAVGGGSVIDAAKAAAALAPFTENVRPYFDGEVAVPAYGLPLLALPTTAGSGAEITSNAVLTDPVRGVKKSLRSPHLVPAAALVDAELTLSQPPNLTAWSGLDALTQALESYLSLQAHAASRALARQAVRQIMEFLPVAAASGHDREARTRMAEGSLLSAMAFSQSGLGAVHGLAHPLGLALGLAHGLTCAILLPHVLRLNAGVCAGELAELAAFCGLRSGEDFVGRIDALGATLGVPHGFAGHGLRPEHFGQVLVNCRSASMKANPRPLSDADITELLTALAGL